ASAHSLQEFEQELSAKEEYFQPIDKPAPGFRLQDAEGHIIRLGDFRGKVVVLHFIYTNCPDLCPLHAELIAKLQSMINLTPMKEAGRFISITTDPSKDRGAVLPDYRPRHGLDRSNGLFVVTY